jgi:hypothetical protein
MANQLGFTFPPPAVIIQGPTQENEKLLDRKARILTELAAIEQGISLFDFLDPARDQLQSSVTDVPCQVKLLSGARDRPNEPLNIHSTSTALGDIILQIGKNPSRMPVECPRGPPTCDAIVNHAKIFFAQLRQIHNSRAGLATAFGVLPHAAAHPKQPLADVKTEDEPQSAKRVHPFFPDVQGLGPLLGHMKEQLGEFPNFVRNPPDDAECEELRLAAEPDCLRKHLLEICGSSSDDEFDPDAALEATPQTTFQHGIMRPI